MQTVEAFALTSLHITSEVGPLQASGALQNLNLSRIMWEPDTNRMLPLIDMTGLTALELSQSGLYDEMLTIPISLYFNRLTALRKLRITGVMDPCQSLLQPFSSLIRSPILSVDASNFRWHHLYSPTRDTNIGCHGLGSASVFVSILSPVHALKPIIHEKPCQTCNSTLKRTKKLQPATEL